MFGKKKCTADAIGKIIYFRVGNSEMPTQILVEFIVDEQKYIIKDTLKLESETIYAGKIPVGQRKQPKLKSTDGTEVREGSLVYVKYNPKNPNKAYILGNEGITNV